MSFSTANLPPPSILIVGAGVFGLSTLHTLLSSKRYKSTHLTIIDTLPIPINDTESKTKFHVPTASLDSSRIIRADYAHPAYAALAAEAQQLWRQGWGGVKKDRYSECGLVLTAYDDGEEGEKYMENSLQNVTDLNADAAGSETTSKKHETRLAIEELSSHSALVSAMRGTHGASGSKGYINHLSGWADAEGAIKDVKAHTLELGTKRGNFSWRSGKVVRLLFSEPLSSSPPDGSNHAGRSVVGAALSDGTCLYAELTILATGAWTSALLDLRGRVQATGQVLAYTQLTVSEAQRLKDMPVLLNMSTGMFILPPTPKGMLKVARHGFGYKNMVEVPNPEASSTFVGDNDGEEGMEKNGKEEEAASAPTTPSSTMSISLPAPDFHTLPPEALATCTAFLREMVPWLSCFSPSPPASTYPPSSPFTTTRLCWYTDTPTGDFLITYHPSFPPPNNSSSSLPSSLLLATGGSGHAYNRVSGGEIEARLSGTVGMAAWG
ncbi:hypothetical protein MMC06_001087 [Schaereria dolodes]|nr:hypothetical protein [Schaereria dolodes]